MGARMKSLGIDQMGVEERLALLDEIWDSITDEGGALPLPNGQRAELERRFNEDEAHPDDVASWEAVKAATLARLGR